jgi:gluconokinase
MQRIIGVDIGTTHVKAVVASAAGKILYEAKAAYPTLNPFQGYHEQNPNDIFEAVLSVLRESCEFVNDMSTLACVSFSAAMHSMVAVDAEGKPLTSLITWADTRSNKYAQQLKDSREGTLVYERTGTPVHPMSPLCKIAWLRNEMPVVFVNTFKFISGKEYIFYQLFGEFVVDHSIASATGLFDIHQKKWCDESMKFAGITGEQLSRPVSTTQAFTKLKDKYQQLLNLPAGIPFLIGASDGCLANIGAGAVLPGELALTIGTSGAVRKLSQHINSDPGQRLFNYILDDATFLTGGAINNGGIVLKWFLDAFIDEELSDEEKTKGIMEKASRVSPGSEGLIFLPYLYGERAPVWDASAKGVFIGISSMHKKEHFMRAVLEGISFSLLQIVKSIEESGEAVDTVFANGGFIQSSLWVKILADILNKKIVVSHAGDASAMGAVFLAMKYLGTLKEWSDVKAIITADEQFYPDPLLNQQYSANYGIFEHLYEKLKDDFQKIDQIQSREVRKSVSQ